MEQGLKQRGGRELSSMNLRISSSSLKGLESAISSGGMLKPVKEKEKPRLALEARLSAALLLTSSRSSLLNCALRDLRMCAFRLMLPRPGDAGISLLLDFLDSVPPFSADTDPAPDGCPTASPEVVADLKAAATVSSSWSDIVLASPGELVLSIVLSIPSPSYHHMQDFH